MSNRCYLYALRDVSMLADSSVRRDPHDFVCVAEGSGYCVPLPWIAMFRSDDLLDYTEVFQPLKELKGKEIMNPDLARDRPMPALETENRRSPVAAREKVFAQLHEAKDALLRVFPEHPFLPDYLDILREVLERLPHPLFLVDCGEIESMWPARFWSEFEFLLDGWGNPESELVEPAAKGLLDRILGRTPPPRRTPWREVLWSLAGLAKGGEIPDPRDEEVWDDENGCRLMPYAEKEAEAVMSPPRSDAPPA